MRGCRLRILVRACETAAMIDQFPWVRRSAYQYMHEAHSDQVLGICIPRDLIRRTVEDSSAHINMQME